MTNFRTLATETLARMFARADEYKKRLASSPGQMDLFGGPRADVQKSVKFDPDAHPRAPKGDTSHHGGQFVPKGDVTAAPGDEPKKLEPEPEKKPEPASNEGDPPELPEDFYDTEFDTGEPVGRAVMLITPWQTGRGFNPNPPKIGPDMNMVEGEIAGFPITTTERGLIEKVTKRTKQLFEDAMSDPAVVQSMHDAGITHLRLTAHSQTGFPRHWTMSHSDGGLVFHTRTALSIESSNTPERRTHGIKRVIHHEAGHGLWNNANPEQRKAFIELIANRSDAVNKIGTIVNVKPPRDSWDYDEKSRAADEVHAELHAMKHYDPSRYSTFPDEVVRMSEDIDKTGKILSERIRNRGQIVPLPKWSGNNKDDAMSNDEPSQYTKRPVKSSPGQKDLFGGKTTSGPQKDLLASKSPDKKWSHEDEKKHPRDESGKFTFLNAGTGEKSKAVHDALDTKHTIDPDMVGMMFNVVHPSQHGDLRKAIDAARPDLSDVTEKHEREHAAIGKEKPIKGGMKPLPTYDTEKEQMIADLENAEGFGAWDAVKKMRKELDRKYPGWDDEGWKSGLDEDYDKLPGGKGDKTPESALPPKELAKGAAVESEHTSDPATAKEIAKDHLTEDTGYYDKLKKMEEKPKTPPSIPGQQRGLFNETPSGQKKLFDFVPPSKGAKKSEPEKSLAESIEPVKQVESLPGQKSLIDSATEALSKAGLHQGATAGDNQEKIRGLPHGGTVEISRVGDTSVKAERSGDGKTLTTYRETPRGSEVIKRERWPYETRDWDAQGNWLGGKIATDDPRWKAFMASPERKARLAKQEPKSIAASAKEKDPEAAVAKAEARAELNHAKIAELLASHLTSEKLHNPSEFRQAYMDLDDAEKVNVAKELSSRGLLNPKDAKKRKPLTAIDIIESAHGAYKQAKNAHQDIATNRHVPFSESEAFKKMKGTK